ncbi:hypothetical protein BGZ96_000787, partial [Linnemannia gamsii]
MSSLPYRKFFEVPELVEQLWPFLSPHDLAQLLRTSRVLYNATYLHFWRKIDLEDDHHVDRLITAPEALGPLAKNAPYIDTLKAGYFFISYYFEGLMQYLDEQELESKSLSNATTPQIERPYWLPEAIIRNPPANSFPPITGLTHLNVSFNRRYSGIQFDNVMRLKKPIRLLRPLAWMMNLNAAGLTHVCFRHMDLPTSLELRCLARSLSGLINLTHLRIEMFSAGSVSWLSAPMIPVLFFAFPRSVVSVKLEAYTDKSNNEEDDERRLRAVLDTGEEDCWGEEDLEPSLDWDEGDLVAREEPLENLRELVLPIFRKGYTADHILRILRQCPALETWDIPSVRNKEAGEVMTRTIREMAIRDEHSQGREHGQEHEQGQESKSRFYLRHLTVRDPWLDNGGEKWISVMDALPEQQVQSTEFFKYQDSYPERTLPALLRHCDTLQSIIFQDTENINNRTLATILRRCRGLETFWVTGLYGLPITLYLDTAIQQEWVCTGLKDLRITVDLSVLLLQRMERGDIPAGPEGRRIYRETVAVSRIDDPPTKEYWAKLEKFYTQLGKLTCLEVLELLTAKIQSGANHMAHPLPGLLSLQEEDERNWRRGFLSLLSGLKKLRVVHGSLWAGSEDSTVTFGQRETEWILENWPALESIEFLPEG